MQTPAPLTRSASEADTPEDQGIPPPTCQAPVKASKMEPISPESPSALPGGAAATPGLAAAPPGPPPGPHPSPSPEELATYAAGRVATAMQAPSRVAVLQELIQMVDSSHRFTARLLAQLRSQLDAAMEAEEHE